MSEKYVYDSTLKKILLASIRIPVIVDPYFVQEDQPNIFGDNDIDRERNIKDILEQREKECNQDIIRQMNLNVEKVDDTNKYRNKNIQPFISGLDENIYKQKESGRGSYRSTEIQHNFQYTYPNTKTVVPEKNTLDPKLSFVGIGIANNDILIRCGFTIEERNKYKIVLLYVLYNIKEDYYYDNFKNVYVSRTNKINELKNYFDNNNIFHDLDLATKIYNSEYTGFQDKIKKFMSKENITENIYKPGIPVEFEDRQDIIESYVYATREEIEEYENIKSLIMESKNQINVDIKKVEEKEEKKSEKPFELSTLSRKVESMSKPTTELKNQDKHGLSVLDFLNDLVLKKSEENPKDKFSCDFLVSQSERYSDNNDNYEESKKTTGKTNYESIMKIRSEIYYNPNTKTYDFICREVDDINRKYDNIKIMLKNWLKSEIKVESLILANRISQDLWKRKYFNYLSVSPILLEYINNQRLFWLKQYEIEYQNKFELYQHYKRIEKEKKYI